MTKPGGPRYRQPGLQRHLSPRGWPRRGMTLSFSPLCHRAQRRVLPHSRETPLFGIGSLMAARAHSEYAAGYPSSLLDKKPHALERVHHTRSDVLGVYATLRDLRAHRQGCDAGRRRGHDA